MIRYPLLIIIVFCFFSSAFARSDDCYADKGAKGIKNICDEIKYKAHTGVSEAEYNYSEMYFKGIGVEKDEQKGMQWLYKAARHEFAHAQYDLAIKLERADRYHEAFKWMLKAARQGISDAQYSIGCMYEYGRGVKKDYSKAMIWYKKASIQGHPQANQEIWSMYYMGKGVEKNTSVADRWSMKHLPGLHRLKRSIFDSLYTLEHLESIRAEKFYRKNKNLADEGNHQAQYNIGYMLESGQLFGFKHNQEAFKWYQLAATAGHPDAQYRLGLFYLPGKKENVGFLLDKSNEYAFRWFMSAAKQNHAAAQHMIGKMYALGRGVKKNLNKAFNWNYRSAMLGNGDGQYYTAKLLELGSGVRKDSSKALYWYSKSGEQGNIKAYLKLAHFYHKGIGVEKNNNTAYSWYQMAANDGNIKAQYILNNHMLESNDKTESIKYLLGFAIMFLMIIISSFLFFKRKCY